MKLKDTCSWKESYDKTRQGIKKQRHQLSDKCPHSQSYGLSSSHVLMWVLDHKEAEHWRTDAFELWIWRRLESPLDCKEIKPVNPKGNQPWIFIGRTDANTEAPILWPFDANSRLIRKVSDAGKDWGQEEKGMKEGVSGHSLSNVWLYQSFLKILTLDPCRYTIFMQILVCVHRRNWDEYFWHYFYSWFETNTMVTDLNNWYSFVINFTV